jgi:hypothetical protein
VSRNPEIDAIETLAVQGRLSLRAQLLRGSTQQGFRLSDSPTRGPPRNCMALTEVNANIDTDFMEKHTIVREQDNRREIRDF